MTKITTIHGHSSSLAGEPDPEIISLLEDLLEKARSGEVQGIGTVQMDSRNMSSFSFAGYITGFGLIGAAQHLIARFVSAADE